MKKLSLSLIGIFLMLLFPLNVLSQSFSSVFSSNNLSNFNTGGLLFCSSSTFSKSLDVNNIMTERQNLYEPNYSFTYKHELGSSNSSKLFLDSNMKFSKTYYDFNFPQVSSSGRVSRSGSPFFWAVLIGGTAGVTYAKVNDMDGMSTFLIGSLGAATGAMIVYLFFAYKK